MPVPELTARELARALQAPEAERPVILDVRNPDEVRFAPFPGALHVPMHELPARLDEVREAADRPVVVLCHLGVRSHQAAAFLDDPHGIRAVLDAIDRLADDPRPAGSFPYGSPDLRRLRVGPGSCAG